MKKTAVEYFKSGKNNCAQAVARAWSDFSSSEENYISEFASCGSGKAPEGLCGALYAAKVISGNEYISELFAEKTGGHITCREIRSNRVMSCAECVAISAEILESADIAE
jgi:hypothetical protein